MKPPIDPDGTRLPIKLGSTSNGEFVPVPLSPADREANRLAFEFADRNSKLPGLYAAKVYGLSAAEMKQYTST